jgi:hypothetical protein
MGIFVLMPPPKPKPLKIFFQRYGIIETPFSSFSFKTYGKFCV